MKESERIGNGVIQVKKSQDNTNDWAHTLVPHG